jgi:two-component system chemotaxis sensor kinase CheA
MNDTNSEKKRYRLGEILINLGALTQEELDRALEIQANQPADEKYPIGRILLEEGCIEPNDLIEAIKIQSMQA